MQPNRSERRAIIKAEAKQLKKEGKKLAKNGTNSSRFNSKKSSRRKDDSHITDLFAASKSTDTFTIEYIHLSPDYDDSQEDDSDLEEKVANEQNTTITATENINVVILDSASIVCEEQSYIKNQLDIPDPSPGPLECMTNDETQGLTNKDDRRSIQSEKTDSNTCQIARPLVLTADTEDVESKQINNESAIGTNNSEEKNQCTFLSLSEEGTQKQIETPKEQIVERVQESEKRRFTPSVSSTVSVAEEKEIKSPSIYPTSSPYPSGETLKPPSKSKRNVFYRVFKRKSEKVTDKIASVKVVEEKKKTKKTWKIWKKLQLA
ncbi:hypothetical protein G6F37_001597 [Rhizopus arrhizus]|nr:hypothetical protein G6F38_001738 [Rhizopus arrhizus]KAG1163028.1 hypothetical protein G6F37_001597 [Rhizopus arrhizus]